MPFCATAGLQPPENKHGAALGAAKSCKGHNTRSTHDAEPPFLRPKIQSTGRVNRFGCWFNEAISGPTCRAQIPDAISVVSATGVFQPMASAETLELFGRQRGLQRIASFDGAKRIMVGRIDRIMVITRIKTAGVEPPRLLMDRDPRGK